MTYGIYSMDTMQDYAEFKTLKECKDWVETYEKDLEESKYIAIVEAENHDNMIFYANIEWADGKSNIKDIAEKIGSNYEAILIKIANDSKNYDDFQKYVDDAGWESWMDNYTEADDLEVCSDSDLKRIVAIQKEGWNRSH